MDSTDNDAAQRCGCASFAIDRRRFLISAAGTTGVLAAGQLFGDAFQQVAYGAETGNNVVVVLSLRGGADGLSMVVPVGADHQTLASSRQGIVVPEAALIAKDAYFGLHPAFQPLESMWSTSKSFAAVHAVGLPAPNRSHFDSMVEIEDAAVNDGLRTGWINRSVGLTAQPRPETAVGIGSVLLPTSLAGPAPALGTDKVADLSLTPIYDEKEDQTRRRRSVEMLWAADQGAAGGSVRQVLATTQTLAPLVAGAKATPSAVRSALYPEGPLRDVLANTAALIKADVGTKFVTVDYGNWDMHVGLGGVDAGWMTDQIGHLAGSLKAFFDDLGAAASRVTVVTMSEFGRRVAQNGSGGVDHGYGNAMLLLGAGVNGGAVRGRWPGLSKLKDGDLDVKQNFQSVLWEVIRSRFPDLSGQRATIFPDLPAPETIGAMV